MAYLTRPIPFPLLWFFLMAVPAGAAGETVEWPEFRGPGQDGVVPPGADGSPRDLPVQWGEDENIVWKCERPSRSWSTPVVGEGKIWMTEASDDGTVMSVVCVDLETGEVVHDEVLFRNPAPEVLGNPLNGYASPSPVLVPGRVFVHFGSYGTACLDTRTAEVLWERRDLPCRHYRGPGSSPVLWDDLLVLTMDGVDVQYLVALDPRSGDTVWRTDRTTDFNDLDAEGKPKMEGDLRKAYSTPLVVDVGGNDQLVSCGAKAAYGYDPATGKELWKIRYDGFSNASRPVANATHVFLNMGFGAGGIIAVRLDPDARGDITDTHIDWELTKRAPQKPSPVLVDGLLYFCNDGGIATCLDPATGDEVWSERLEGKFSASPIANGDKIYIPNEHSSVFVVRAGRSFELLAENRLGDGMMASPAVAGDDLILRTRSNLYRVRSPQNP